MKKLPPKIKNFFIIIYLITILSIIVFFKLNYLQMQNFNYLEIIFFSLLVMLTETFTVLYRDISFSTTFVIQLASLIIFGPIVTILVSILGFTFRVLKVKDGYKHIFNTPFYGTVFNYCILTLSVLYGNFAYIVSGGYYPINSTTHLFLQIMLFSIIFFLTNTLSISILFSLSTGKKLIYCYLSNIRLSLLNIVAMAPFGIILAFIYKNYRYGGVLLVLFPIVLVRYTFSLYIDSKTQYVQTVDSLMRAMEARDKYTEGHSQRVAEIVSKIAKELKYSDIKIEQLNIASLLHDVGKIGIDDNILNKPGKLTNEEYEIIKKHPEIGFNILKDIKNLENILPVVRHHHEKYNGTGYPDRKNADELPFDVFIIQLADSIDAMATDRPYRRALTEEQIIDEIKRCAGTQFHPKVVEAYLNILEKQKKVV